MTLGFTVGDVGAWLFILWVCVDWYINLTLPMEDFMKKKNKTAKQEGFFSMHEGGLIFGTYLDKTEFLWFH